jgi:hypothetical protein
VVADRLVDAGHHAASRDVTVRSVGMPAGLGGSGSLVAPGQTAQRAVTVRNWTDRQQELATDDVAGSIVSRNLNRLARQARGSGSES